MGKDEREIVEQCIRMRQPYPDTIAKAPELGPGLNLFYMAFMDLMSCRSLGYAQGPIPWLAIHHYCEANEIVGEQREDVFYHTARLDKAYLDWSADRSKALAKQNAPTKSATPPRRPARKR